MTPRTTALFFVGLGADFPAGLTLESLRVIESVQKVFLETYTNFMPDNALERLKFIAGRDIVPIERKTLENESARFLTENLGSTVALLISGDPFIATTHHALWLEADARGFEVYVINNT